MEKCVLAERQGGDRRRLWLGSGLVAGTMVGVKVMRRWWARRTSPIRYEQGPRTALITGASSGIGEAYATKLAELGYDVILVARRQARLEALAAQLATTYEVAAATVAADLTTDEGLNRVAELASTAESLSVLVNNAGFGLPGSFMASPLPQQEEMIRLHVLAVVKLTRAALPMMLAHRRGAIVNVASVMAFYPLAGSVTYGATKSYLHAFTEALHQELAGTGIRVQSLCPGFTRTELQEVADIDRTYMPDFLWMSPEKVVEQSLRDLDNDRVLSVPGLGYRMMVAARRLLPRQIIYLLGRTWAALGR